MTNTENEDMLTDVVLPLWRYGGTIYIEEIKKETLRDCCQQYTHASLTERRSDAPMKVVTDTLDYEGIEYEKWFVEWG